MEIESKQESIEIKYDAINGLSLGNNKQSQFPPSLATINKEWMSHEYNLVDLNAHQTISGVEELCAFIMNGGCTILWHDDNLYKYCLNSKDNFVYFLRAVAWATLGTNSETDSHVVLLKKFYNQWFESKQKTQVILSWESAGSFTWFFDSCDRWGSSGWVTEVLLIQS